MGIRPSGRNDPKHDQGLLGTHQRDAQKQGALELLREGLLCVLLQVRLGVVRLGGQERFPQGEDLPELQNAVSELPNFPGKGKEEAEGVFEGLGMSEGPPEEGLRLLPQHLFHIRRLHDGSIHCGNKEGKRVPYWEPLRDLGNKYRD